MRNFEKLALERIMGTREFTEGEQLPGEVEAFDKAPFSKPTLTILPIWARSAVRLT